MPLGIGVMSAVLYTAAKRRRMIFANLGVKITAILFKNKGKISKLTWELRSFKYYFISDDLRSK